MTTPNNYEPLFSVGSGDTVTVPITWPFSGSIDELYIYQQNTDTQEIKYNRDGDFEAQVVTIGEAVSLTSTGPVLKLK